MPWEEAPMGTTGLETAFAAVHTELVVPGVLPLALVVEKLSAGAALFGLRAAADRGRPPGGAVPDRPRGGVGGRRGRLREPLGELLLRRPHAARQGARHRRRRRGRLPGAGVRPDRRVSGSVRPRTEPGRGGLRPARGRRPLRRRRRRRARPGDRRGRLHDRHVGLPGVDERPELRAPADHVHLPAHRQLRGQRGGHGVRPHPRARGDHARGGQPRPTRRAPSAAGSTGCATAASRASTASTRARSCATSARRARCAAASSRAR